MKRLALLSLFGMLAFAACDSPVELADGPPATVLTATDNTTTGEALSPTSSAYAFPSTNEANYQNGHPHVVFTDVDVGQVTFTFVNETNSLAFFEVRIDGEVLTSGNAHDVITGDFVYPGVCVDNRAGTTVCGGQQSSKTMTFAAGQTVDVRLALGGERDWDFDWTRFYVLSLENKDQCRDGAWEALGFKNLGQCVRFVETGKDSRSGG